MMKVVVSNNKIRSSEHKLKYRKFHENIAGGGGHTKIPQDFFIVNVVKH